jgi:signal peptidase I
MNASLQKHWKENRGLVYFIVLMIVFRSSLADWNTVPTGSMNPTIIEGDRILVNKLAYDLKLPLSHFRVLSWNDPERGDIIVFDSRIENTRLVKRVIGLPGDVIAMNNNQLYINGNLTQYSKHDTLGSYQRATEQLPGHSHAMQIAAMTPSSAGSFNPVTVPPGHFLVLGDNRDNSKDSRYIGFIPRGEIIGRASYVVLSFNYDNYYLPRKHRFLHRLDSAME